MPCHCKQLLACTSWLAVVALLLGCAAQPLPDCRLPETCPPLEILPDPEPVLQSSSHPAQLAAHVSVDLTSPPRNISDSLFGLFFEEVRLPLSAAAPLDVSTQLLSSTVSRSSMVVRAASTLSLSRTGALRASPMPRAMPLASWSPRT